MVASRRGWITKIKSLSVDRGYRGYFTTRGVFANTPFILGATVTVVSFYDVAASCCHSSSSSSSSSCHALRLSHR